MSSKSLKRKKKVAAIRSIPVPTLSQVVTVRLTSSEKDSIRKYCAQTGVTVQSFMRAAITHLVEELNAGTARLSLQGFDVTLNNISSRERRGL